MSLSSASTDQQVIDAYGDNADWDQAASATKAAAFVVACRHLLLRLPRLASQGSAQVAFSPDLIRKEMAAAQAYAAAALSGTGSGTGAVSARYADFRGFRS